MKKEKLSVAIRDRIVGHDDVLVSQLLNNPNNWRIHPKAQQEALAGVLKDIGWVQGVIVNVQTGNLVDGHLRAIIADREGVEKIPGTQVDLTKLEEAEILATYDPIGAMATTDKEKLTALMRDIDTENAAVQQLISDFAEKEGLLLNLGDGEGGGDKEEKERAPVISYLIVFDDDNQQEAWFKFLRYLKAQIDAGETIASKLAVFIEEGGYVSA